MWWKFDQNNSGGDFIVNESVTYSVWIEAETAEAVNAKAEEIGIYFDGCRYSRDCSCCGDRWDRAYGKGERKPNYEYSVLINPNAKSWSGKYKHQITRDMQKAADQERWAKIGTTAVILYYANGDIQRFTKLQEPCHE